MSKVNWIPLESIDQLPAIKDRSKEIPCLIFKHSTTCSISSMAKYRLEGDWEFDSDKVEAYFLDLLQNRSLSSAVADFFGVHHESPQILLIENGECTLDASHLDVSVPEIKSVLKTA